MEKAELEKLKEQLLDQISSFPPDKANVARQQIEGMNDQQFEEFLMKNKMIKGHECVFCLIGNKEVDSFIIAERDDLVVVLEINPISPAHLMIVPKEHISEVELIENKIIEVAKLISGLVKSKLAAKRVEWLVQSRFGHVVLNLIPVYERDFDLPRQKAEQKDLEKLRSELQFEFDKHEEPEKEEPVESKSIEYEIPKRVP